VANIVKREFDGEPRLNMELVGLFPACISRSTDLPRGTSPDLLQACHELKVNTLLVAEDSAVGLWGTGYDGYAYRYDEAINYEASSTYTDATAVGTKMSAGMSYSWKSPWTVFERPESVKRVKRVRTTLNRKSDHLSMDVRKNWETDGIVAAANQLSMYGRSSNLSGSLIYEKSDFSVQGQALQMHYYTSAGAATTSPPPCTHYWTIHEIAIDVDMMGTHFYGEI
jgi:hypothetical protein